MTVMTLSKKRRKKKNPLLKFLIAGGCAMVLIVLGIIGVESYQTKMLYANYPLKYKEEIVENARNFDLEPWHIAAVVRCESSFNPKATSSVGAMGLMQILPETGEWLAGKFDEDDNFDPQTLYEPAVNLKYGCWFLSWLMRKYDGDITLATAAYHAGHGCVNNWLANSAVSADGKSIALENIPYDSTRTYVQRILKAYENYKELYDYDI